MIAVDTVTNRWIKNAADERAASEGCVFDQRKADHITSFFERFLYHSMGDLAGQPFVLLPWQREDFLCPLFGWRRPDGARRFSKADVWIAKKQGKSTLAAGIVCYALLFGGQRSEVYGVAHTRDQAGIIYREAEAMATGSPQLNARLRCYESKKRIVYHREASFYQALAGENCSRGVEGINPTLIVFDEIHVQRSRVLYDTLAYASSARPNSLMLSVSTVGVADPTSIWWEQYDYCKRLHEGSIYDAQRFALIYQADEGCRDDPNLRADPAQWRKAMPSLGATVTEDKVAAAVLEAENSPSKMGSLLRYMFNIPTAQVERCVPIHLWRQRAVEPPDLRRRPCYAGLDLASSEDLAALALFFPAAGEDRAYCTVTVWCPAEKIVERERRRLAHYRQWSDDGHLLETAGNRIDHDAIRDAVVDAFAEYDLRELGFDPWNADAVVNPLLADGYAVVQVAQTVAGMSSGTKKLLDMISAGELDHDGSPVLEWALGNCAADERPDGGIKFSKDKSADKVDPAVALAMAVGRWLVADELPAPGVW